MKDFRLKKFLDYLDENRKKITLRLSLILFSLLISLLVLEAMARLLYAGPYIDFLDPTMTVSDSRKFALKPNFEGRFTGVNVKLNAFGFRDFEIKQKLPGETRILALGDSVFFGYKVEQGLDILSLTEVLANENGLNLEVINTAVPAYALPHEIATYEYYKDTLDPDIVLVGLVLNDIKIPSQVSDLNASKKNQKASLVAKFKKYLIGHSKLASYMLSKSPNLLFQIGYSKPFEPDKSGDIELDSLAIVHSDIEKNDMYMQKYRQALDYFEKEAVNLKKLTDDKGDRLVFLLFPWREQLSRNCWHSYNQDLLWKNIPLDEYALEGKPQTLISDVLTKNEIEYLDLLPIYREKDKRSNQCLLMNDRTHPTSDGHKVAAEALVKFLIEKSN